MTRLRLPLVCLSLALAVSGCTRMIAAASGPEPLGVREGERTLSQRVEDLSIEKSALINLYKLDPGFKQAHVLVLSFHSNVLLAGQVPDARLKQLAEKILQDMAEVRSIHNELRIGDNTPLLTRARDSIISARVGSALTFARDFPSSQCKILVEDGVVYLVAKVTHADADRAISIIREVPEVKGIVKLVDYLQ